MTGRIGGKLPDRWKLRLHLARQPERNGKASGDSGASLIDTPSARAT
jgi:hypothetical protein